MKKKTHTVAGMNLLQFVLGSITKLPVHLYFSVMLVRGLNSTRVVSLSLGKLMLDRSSATEPVTLKVNKITQSTGVLIAISHRNVTSWLMLSGLRCITDTSQSPGSECIIKPECVSK